MFCAGPRTSDKAASGKRGTKAPIMSRALWRTAVAKPEGAASAIVAFRADGVDLRAILLEHQRQP